MTADEPGTTGGVRQGEVYRPERKPALWRRVLAWIVGKVPEPKSGRFGG